MDGAEVPLRSSLIAPMLLVVGFVGVCLVGVERARGGDSDSDSSPKPKDAGGDAQDSGSDAGTDSGSGGSDAGTDAAADAAVEADAAKTCVSSCTTNAECQNSCPSADGGINCCDTQSNVCYTSATATCPAPPPDGGPLPY